MKRYLLVLAVGLAGFGPVARASRPKSGANRRVRGGVPEPRRRLRGDEGGTFEPGGHLVGLRALKYTGGSIPDVLACLAYVRSCCDPETGGFAQTPGGKPDVPTTAVGLMASIEQKNLTDEMAAKAAAFFSEHAKGSRRSGSPSRA